jgi:NDP-sugar pyrophosphorylase family protein
MKPTLLILAAGIGSRYGGLKQVDGMGPGGEAILDYSVFDAIRAGFGKVVFVIRKDIETAFREKVGHRIEKQIHTEYAFQEKETALEWLPELPHREKPWGTGHAILSAKHLLNEPFVAINADDYYGASAFQLIGDFLRTDCSPANYGMVAYKIGKTLSENGTVSRGVCSVNKEGFLTAVTERHGIERIEKQISFTVEDKKHKLTAATPVSMNFWGFHPTVLDEIESQFKTFVHDNFEKPKAEFYIPSVVNSLIESGKINLTVLTSNNQWYGVTYTNDKDTVQAALKNFAKKGTYPNPLWK